jgi:hypothetical protein
MLQCVSPEYLPVVVGPRSATNGLPCTRSGVHESVIGSLSVCLCDNRVRARPICTARATKAWLNDQITGGLTLAVLIPAMTSHSEVAPDTLAIDLTEDGIEVEYADGRRVFYRGVPTREPGALTPPPGKDIHVLVTDESESRGVLIYVDERTTEDEILEATGVGRILLAPGGETTVFPDVTVNRGDVRIEIEADLAAIEGRVFVFAEDEMGERSYELVPDTGT